MMHPGPRTHFFLDLLLHNAAAENHLSIIPKFTLCSMFISNMNSHEAIQINQNHFARHFLKYNWVGNKCGKTYLKSTIFILLQQLF